MAHGRTRHGSTEESMPTEEAFVQAIIADPDDDAPRLIYADWLDEQGESERAEFIRVQVALARMDEDDERRPELEARKSELTGRLGAAREADADGRPAELRDALRGGFGAPAATGGAEPR